ncbi:MAG TPA: hypothetical protein VNB52_08900, partial [Ilumatobacteraceae bacterium]|nr:hypothetical protein [Ilumatobacteraceae bacterium]
MIRCHDSGDNAFSTGAGCAAGTVEERLVLGGRIDVDDQRDVVDVDTAGGDVGSHQHADLAAGEVGQVALADALREVAVQFHSRDARRVQLLGKLFGTVLGSHEQQRTIEPAGKRADDGRFVARSDGEDVMRHGVDRRHFRIDG